MENVNSTETVREEVRPRSRPRWGRILVWTGLLALLAVVGLQLIKTQQGPVGLGRPVPAYTLTTFDDSQISSADLAGKVVVINFWASWCKPCEQEAAELEEAWRFYQPRGDVVFLGIAYTDTEKKALGYLERFGITYPNGPDLGTRISHAFGITGVPETYIVDRDGNLAHFKKGPFNSLAEIRRAVDSVVER